MLELIDLKEWKKVKEIQEEIFQKTHKKVSRRMLRTLKEAENERFFNGDYEYCVARSDKGYIRTKDEEIIIKSERQDMAQAMDLLVKVSKSRRARGNRDQIKIKINKKNELYIVGI